MVFSSTTLRRTVATSVVTVTLAFGPLLSAIAQTISLSGAGATFPEPLYQRYFAEFQKKNPGIQVNYQGIGSGGGIKQMTAGTVDFAASDTAMTDKEAAEVERGVVFVPTAGGPVAAVYNLPGVSQSLKLSQEVLPAIFAGQITRWNDPKIAADNPGVNLPDRPIRLAVRADSSGTTFIFTNALSAMDPYFKGRVGADKAPRWPGRPLSAKGNPGVAQTVKRTPFTIGYVEASFANENQLQTALVENEKGAYVAPTIENANRALENVEFDPDFRVDFEKLGAPADGYPITGLTWMMVYKQYPDAAKADAVKKLVQYSLTEGQALNDDLTYTEIPDEVAQQVIQAVNSTVTTGGSASR